MLKDGKLFPDSTRAIADWVVFIWRASSTWVRPALHPDAHQLTGDGELVLQGVVRLAKFRIL